MQVLIFSLLSVHIAAGTAAVIVGLFALPTTKPIETKAGRAHQRAGKLFFISMIVVIGTAIVLFRECSYAAIRTLASALGNFARTKLGNNIGDTLPTKAEWLVQALDTSFWGIFGLERS
jgi:hypothetical protein